MFQGEQFSNDVVYVESEKKSISKIPDEKFITRIKYLMKDS